jgi:cytochrome c biogenesis protein CcmG/thiol:disulfide interchange protein DsbE
MALQVGWFLYTLGGIIERQPRNANSGSQGKVCAAAQLRGRGLDILARKGETMQQRRAWLLIAVLAALGMVSGLAACGGSGSSSASANVQFVAPKDFSVAHYAGKPLVVNYFGSWCGPCNAEAPELSTFSKAQSGKVAFVGVAVNDKESDVVGFMTKYGLHYPVVLDDNSLSAKESINGVPTTIFYNASGQEVDRIVGAASLQQFNTSLAKAQ